MNKHQMFIGGVDGEKKIGILVDAMGRINYGEKLLQRDMQECNRPTLSKMHNSHNLWLLG